MFSFAAGDYEVHLASSVLPSSYGYYAREALLVDEFDLQSREPDSGFCFLAVKRQERWPLVLGRRYELQGAGFAPGALLVVETEVLFFGAGPWIMAYDLGEPRKLWEDYTYPGFYGWSRHGDFVLMSAEIEFVAYDLLGRRLWVRDVEPPWDYSIEGGSVRLSIDGTVTHFSLNDQ